LRETDSMCPDGGRYVPTDILEISGCWSCDPGYSESSLEGCFRPQPAAQKNGIARSMLRNRYSFPTCDRDSHET
jgi:hypothetical protein